MSSDQFRYLIDRYISDGITPEETVQLRRLLTEPQYAAVLEDIMDRQLAGNTASAGDYSEVVNRLKISLEQKITNEQELPPVRRLSFLRRWAAAAAILVLLAAGYFFLFTDRSSKQAPIVSQSPVIDIAPGKEGAILTLADGRTVVLDSLGNGVIATQNGSTVVLKNGQLAYDADGAATAIAYNTMSTPKGRQFQLVLPDGTKVWLNAASSLRYPTVFAGTEREVEVTGEAYFEVAKNKQKPFRVKINEQTTVEVLGTHFNINSYQNEEHINTTLLEGSVKVINGNERIIITPGQQAQVAGQAKIKVVNGVDLEKVMAWKNGMFNFQDATLKEVMRQLERWYDIDVVYEKGVAEPEFMGKMGKDLSLSEVLRGLRMSEVHTRIEGRKLIVMP